MKIKPLPSLKYLNECFEIDFTCSSGLRWKVRPRKHFSTLAGWNICKGRDAGKEAGSLLTRPDGKKHFQIGIAGIHYLVHRIIYSLHHNIKLFVNIQIDHEDNNGLNNNPANVRLATCSENQLNVKLKKNNSSGYKGVSYSKTGKYWWGQVRFKKERYRIKGYTTAKSCYAALCELREQFHKEFTNHG